jgi:hypothetical protein
LSRATASIPLKEMDHKGLGGSAIGSLDCFQKESVGGF